ncbi:hypothetical protein P9314_19200 [Paenibacillus validus]|uniref:hypothetical protein n=1 Tax=Paenibacillus validus TaxID=44253 RepID=UPI000A7C465E|nr:hypothetical protein [Paenibacillus validus]
MGTRLLSEHLIKNRFPHIRYVRIHSQGKNTATIYAWNNDLDLPDKEIGSLKQFASGHLLPHVCFKVKSYNMVQNDKVPQVHELPAPIVQAAMNRSLDQHGITAVMNRMFPYGSLTFDRYDSISGTIHFAFHANTPVNDIEKERIRQYLYEVIPLGSACEVAYC